MYYIVKYGDEDSFWYDYVCGCHIWKRYSRANSYNTNEGALKDIHFYNITDGEVIYIEVITNETDF